ncbi:MAG: hypothetical protein WAX69_06610, partial [Victivallales bacterium]
LKRFDQYGGVKAGPSAAASGFFRLENLNNRWWFITPEGNRFLLIGVDAVYHDESGYQMPLFKSPGITGVVRDVFTELPDRKLFPGAYNHYFGDGRVSFLLANLQRKYGSVFDQKWADVTRRRLLDWGFNSHSKWSRHGRLRLPYITVLGPSGARRIDWAVDPFDPGFPLAVENGVKKLAKDDPWLVGHTFESETGWNSTIVQKALRGNSGCAAKKAVIDFLASRYKQDLGRVNALLNVNAGSFAELTDLVVDKPELPAQDVSDFIRLASYQYYKIASQIIRKHDPNHLLLGSSLDPGTWQSSEEWATGGAEFLDALSFDTYAGTPDWIRPYRKYGKPILLLEFSFYAAGRGMRGLSKLLPDQKTRGLHYRYQVEQLAANPLMVGFGWFMYYDEPVGGRSLDGEDFNNGLLNLCDQPYTEMIGEMKKTNRRMYGIHSGQVEPLTPYSEMLEEMKKQMKPASRESLNEDKRP